LKNETKNENVKNTTRIKQEIFLAHVLVYWRLFFGLLGMMATQGPSYSKLQDRNCKERIP